MRGTILGIADGRGVLLSADERRLEFPLSEWRSAGAPAAGQAVDFVDEGGAAKAVFAIPGAAAPPRTQSGSFMMSAIALGCLALGFVVPLFPTIAAFVLGAIAASQAQTEKDENALLMARIAWIGALVMLGIGVLAVLVITAIIGTVGFAAIFHGLGPMNF